MPSKRCGCRAPPGIALLVVVIAAAFTITPLYAAVETIKVVDGFLQEHKVYVEQTRLDLTGLDNTRKVSSTATVRDGKIQNILYISAGSGTPSDTFATSLYMTLTKMHIACTSSLCYYNIEDLPPNAYILLKETTSYKTDSYRSMAIQSGWEYNTTLEMVDSVLETDGGGPYAILTFGPTNGSPHAFVDNCLIYIKNMTVIKHQGVINFGSTLEQQSALVLEDVEGVGLRGSMFSLPIVTIKDHSAVIIMRAKNIHDTNANLPSIFEARILTVDETSVFSLIDVDASNGFKSDTIGAFRGAANITGAGEIVFSRLLMQTSGLTNKQPQNNAHFWVSARTTADTDLTVAQLQAQNFNVNSQNVLNWDGTGADGTTCAPVGGSIPGRATYTLVDGKCTRTCNDGFIPPACTAPAKSRCRVDNCDLCYRVTKTKCMLCAEHTTHENNDQICRCPSSLEYCQICPSATTCTMCIEGYNLTKGGAPCIPCSKSVPNCFHCDEPNICEQCAPHYNVSSNKMECYSCNAANCLHCSGNEVCDECAPHYNLSAINTPQNRCISCKLPGCLLCKDDDKCDACAADYTKPEGKPTTCAHCPIEHCERCDVDGVCAKCPEKHTPVDGKHCHPCTMPGCLACDGDEQCANCDGKHTLVNKKCVACDIPHCKSCLTDGVCNDCEPKYTLHNEGAVSECIPCGVDGCATCDSDSHCSACANGNPPLDDGKVCVSCAVPNCVYCNATDSCAACADRYSLSLSGSSQLTCISCNVDHCLSCGSADKCQACEASYNVSKSGDKCISCAIADCQRCDVEGVCAQCGINLSVSLNGGECIPCDIGNCTYCSASGKCSMCTCGSVATTDGKKCVPCTAANCQHCELPGNGKKCAECAEGYDVSAGSCRKSGLPSWVVFLIVVAGTVILVALLCLGVFLYLRSQAKSREIKEDAQERRRNRKAKNGLGVRHHMDIAILDLAELEGAASGVRDDLRYLILS